MSISESELPGIGRRYEIICARIYPLGPRAAANAGLTLLGRGEFSLIIATFAASAGLDSRIAPFVALYVLILAILGPILASRSAFITRFLPQRLTGTPTA